jgi:Tol biopolymer transport system component
MNRTRFTALTAAAFLAAGVTASCGGSGDASATRKPAAKPATPALPGRIVFRRWLDDAKTHGAILIVNADGSGERQLTKPAVGVDDYPDWSPDGKLVAYQHCEPDKACSVWTVRPDGGTPQQARLHCRLKGDCDASAPAWTPNGKLVVTLAQGQPKTIGGEPQIQQSAIEELDLTSGRQHTIYQRTGWAGDAQDAQVSPDGRTVIYSRLNSARSRPPLAQAIFAVGANGSHNHQVAPWRLGGGDHPVFSPSGAVLLRSYEDDESRQSDFWTVRPDGSQLRQLTHFKDGTLVTSASYSPDGAWIVYASDGDGGADLYAMRADGSGQRKLTSTKWWDSAPDWGPVAR